jgi:dCTP deaminase
MIIVGENLKGLVLANAICNEADISEHSLTINLGKTVYRPKSDQEIVKYGKQSTESLFDKEELDSGELLLEHNTAILTSSSSPIKMPLGYMGLIQTKGTLARFLVSSHASSSHIDAGFFGCITLELINNSPFDISIDVGSPIAQIYIVRCSTDNTNEYAGKYSSAEGPRLPKPFYD